MFEHVRDAGRAAAELASVTAAGGHVVWSAPFLERFHRAPVDWARFTNESAAALMRGLNPTPPSPSAAAPSASAAGRLPAGRSSRVRRMGWPTRPTRTCQWASQRDREVQSELEVRVWPEAMMGVRPPRTGPTRTVS